VPEVIAARALGLEVMGLSVITDNSERQSALTLQEIMKKATEKAGVIASIFEGVVKQIS
jgi:purine nucleoside phosphorylase